MSSLTPKTKFLLDENVRIELFKFLQTRGLDAEFSPKGISDSQIASLSKKERKVLITNDADFAEYSNDKVFAVVWLRIPQNDPQSLTSSFAKLIDELKNFEGKLIILEKNKWTNFPLTIDVKLKS